MYFQWKTKNVFMFDVVKKTLHKLQTDITIPNLCKTVASDNGRLFLVGGVGSE